MIGLSITAAGGLVDFVLQKNAHPALPVFVQASVQAGIRKLAPDLALIAEVTEWSMLHYRALRRIYDLSCGNSLACLEIGTFTGGASVAIAAGMRAGANRRPLVLIEQGGQHDHPLLATDDIVRDLRANLDRYGFHDRAVIIEGASWAPGVVERVEKALDGAKIGLLMVDADGEVAADFERFRHLLAPRAIIVCDDYVVDDPGAEVKAKKVKPWLDGMVARGAFELISVEPYGTWFGRVA